MRILAQLAFSRWCSQQLSDDGSVGRVELVEKLLALYGWG
jgi:hypothetical protein